MTDTTIDGVEPQRRASPRIGSAPMPQRLAVPFGGDGGQAERWRPGPFTERVAIVGATCDAGRLIDSFRSGESADVAFAGIFDDRVTRRAAGAEHLRIDGSIDDLLRFARDNPLDRIVLALPAGATGRIAEMVARLRALPVDIVVVSDAEAVPGALGTRWMAGARLSVLVERPMSLAGRLAKRALDIGLSLTVLLLASPLLALIAAAIALDSPGGVLFRQPRIGFNNRPFTMLKFRSMRADAPDQAGVGGTKRGDPRITRVGRWLRRFSLDELPQLVNVLRGDMSVVGPRAQAVNMRVGDHRYADAVARYIERHRVKPGITGLAQVSGARGGIDTLEKAAWAVSVDLRYIQTWSLWLDLRIMVRTALMMLTGRDAV